MLMAGLVASALALALRTNSLIVGALAVGIAAAVKQPALLAAVAVALLTDRPRPSGCEPSCARRRQWDSRSVHWCW